MPKPLPNPSFGSRKGREQSRTFLLPRRLYIPTVYDLILMVSPLKRLTDDIVNTWSTMPKSQALRWYGAVLTHFPTILRERKFYSADTAMKGNLRFFALGRDFNVDVDAINSSPGNGYAFLREFFVRQIYFREFKTLNFDTCLDLGSNTGVVSSMLKQLSGPEGKVIGVDPHTYPDNPFRTRLNSVSGLTIHQGVLCGESIRHDSAALHSMCDRYNFDTKLAITVAELKALYGIKHVDFVKIDIEGAEFTIFRDSVAWLDGIDNLAMEVHRDAGDPQELIAILQQAGYRVKWLDEAGYPTEQTTAGYIYASKNGSLKAEA